jgi:hypothetical protein
MEQEGRMNEDKYIHYGRQVERPVVLDEDALIKHLKAIGKAIIDDADHLTIDSHNLRLVHIDADIAPLEQVTTVRYTLERIADPRRPTKDADTGGEAQDG